MCRKDPLVEYDLVDFKAYQEVDVCRTGDVCCPKENVRPKKSIQNNIDTTNLHKCGKRNTEGVGLHIENLPANRTQFGKTSLFSHFSLQLL